MTELDALLEAPPYALTAPEKEAALLPLLLELTALHRTLCPPYGAMLEALDFRAGDCRSVEELPFLPVGLFKRLELRSAPVGEGKTLTSSGTTGQTVSRIAVDAETAALQRRALVNIVGDFLGPRRLPMLVVDSPAVLRPPLRDTARGAGVLGFSACASRRAFALREDLSLDEAAVAEFLAQAAGGPFFIFGFTFLVWQGFVETLKARGLTPDCSGGILIHGGGWKRLADRAVSRAEFHRALGEVCGLTRIYDYYGMAEQAGSIFMECARGHLHCSSVSQIIVRRSADFSPCAPGEEGLVQVLSALPRSYPGHSLLTGDRGVLLGEDDCPCGRKGRYFKVLGRTPGADLRGCSDVLAAAAE